MRKVIAFIRGTAAYAAGMLAAMITIAVARKIAIGDAFAISPTGLSVVAQLIVVTGWLAGSALGT
jgi:hypothetical protein